MSLWRFVFRKLHITSRCQISITIILTELHVELEEVFASPASRWLLGSHIVRGRPLPQGRLLSPPERLRVRYLVVTAVQILSLDLLKVALRSSVPVFQFLPDVRLRKAIHVLDHLLQLFLAHERSHQLEMVLDAILLVRTRPPEPHRGRSTAIARD